jgi:hypothetical protein
MRLAFDIRSRELLTQVILQSRGIVMSQLIVRAGQKISFEEV